jgi:metal-sulfur cluster biosynthetic enzyme
MMTSPACPLGEVMVEEARLALETAFPNASAIQVELVRDRGWSPKQMSQEGRRQLGLS